MRIGPVAFLFLAVGGWAAVRGLMLWPDERSPQAPRRIAWQSAPRTHPGPLTPLVKSAAGRSGAVIPVKGAVPPTRLERVSASSAFPVLATSARPAISPLAAPGAAPIHLPQPPIAPSASAAPLHLSAWAIWRGRSGQGLASAGQLGGSQAGVRISHDLGSGFAAALRVSGPLRSRSGKEAAVALDWRPVRQVPVTVTIERRAGLDRGGRDAFAASVYGGFDSMAVPGGVRLDGYAQAGLVGLRRRDAYVDGAVRAERPLVSIGGFRLGAGAGLWGGAQPGVSRLDIGPQIVAHAPAGKGAVRIGAEWRQRIAGHARPGSGAAISLGADF
jgi:hypothetical protein